MPLRWKMDVTLSCDRGQASCLQALFTRWRATVDPGQLADEQNETHSSEAPQSPIVEPLSRAAKRRRRAVNIDRTREPPLGGWRLLSWEIVGPDGAYAVGLLTYDTDGRGYPHGWCPAIPFASDDCVSCSDRIRESAIATKCEPRSDAPAQISKWETMRSIEVSVKPRLECMRKADTSLST